ncbi:MAG: tetratricopeptide repeat protein [Candidatus Tectomicrobia bacterium]|uniref:Tetratricopeptide repeat protein n=1 Tax=Tectimicrobiota bacterium TaxID=2528274 RepID=A0A932CMW8_UNCTE|nr:tetratricopeptide repeat protein [Candidatus Tectomicrobia bacterium]
MTSHTFDDLFSRLSDLIAARMGLHFPRERWHDLERGMGAVARELGFKEIEPCIQGLLSSPLTRSQIELLAHHLTVGETYFFREKRSFAALEESILPELIRSRRGTGRHLRIWSAGCATGEEPYSIAILLHRMIPDLQEWKLAILATDINLASLRKAAEGVYSNWSFRDTPPWIKERYFRRKKEGRFEIFPQIQPMVTFAYLNLAENLYPSPFNQTQAMDLIFCRNVLMYFAPERARRAIQNLYLSLVEGGWLIVSPSEVSLGQEAQFTPVHFPEAILYRKEARQKRRDPAPTVPEERPPDQSLSRTRTLNQVQSLPRTRSGGRLCPGPEPAPDQIRGPGSRIRGRPWPVEPLPAISPPPFEAIPRSEPGSLPAADEVATAEGEEPAAAELPPTPYLEARALYQQGRYAEAIPRLMELLSQDPEAPGAMALLAWAHANQGKLAEARAWSERALAGERLNGGLHYLHAMILQEQGAIEEAITSLRRALYLDPQFVLAHFALGNLALQRGKGKESEKHFENALSLLSAYQPEELLPESEGMTAGRLLEILRSTRSRERSA